MKITRHLLRWNLCWAFLPVAFTVFGNPLDNWTILSSGTTNHLRNVAFGGGLFVAVGDSGTVLTSSNGITWTPRAVGITNSLRGVTYGHGQFVSVGAAGTIITSTDGAVWSLQSSDTLNQLNAVTSTDSEFVAAGNLGTILTSSDGSNWIAQTSGTSAPFVGVGVGFGKIFAGATVNPPALFWSTNGAGWSYMTNVPPSQQPDLFNGGFAYGNGILLGVEIRGIFCRSTDGMTWTNHYSPLYYCYGLAYARSVFVTVGSSSSGGRLIGTSTNGLEWQTRYSTIGGGGLKGVAYGRHRFVAVGEGGSILASAPILWLSNPSVVSSGFQMTLNGEPSGVYYIQAATNVLFPSWDNIGVVTNATDSVELTVPLPADSSSAFYRVHAD